MESLSETVYVDVKNVLSELSAQLGTGIETFWPAFVKAQLWSPIFAIVMNIILSILLYKAYKATDDWSYPTFASVLAIIIPGFLLFSWVTIAQDGVCLLSPEYCALKEVLRLLN